MSIVGRGAAVTRDPVGDVAANRPRRLSGVLGSMRIRIVAAVVVLLAFSAGVSILVLRSVLLDRLNEEIAVNLQEEVLEFELLAGGNDPRTGQPFGDDVEALFDIYFAREIPDAGETLLAFVGDELYHAERAQDAIEADRLSGAMAHWLSLDERTEGSVRTQAGDAHYVALPFTREGRSGLFVAANFPAYEQNEIDDAIVTQGLTQLGTILLASLVGLGLAGRVLRPLRMLTDTAQTITATDITRRIPVAGRDEASRIAETFNDMLGRLEAVVATQRQFLDDASHELRVPLTVIRGNVEVLELEPDPAERATMIQMITNEIDRMSRIVEDLLLLARAERPDFLSIETVDLAALMSDIHRKATVLCRRDWRLEEAANIGIRADGQRLTQALMQLSQNACQHTEEGGTIRLGSRVQDGQVMLWVHDSGPGVAAGDAERVFERYVRGSDRPAGSGLGLGLAIVAAIATAHGGRVRLNHEARSGARFEIVLPSNSPGPALPSPRRGIPGRP
jgi:two-component system OmpR family sensor kinase